MRKIRCGFAEPACKTPLHYPGAAHVSVIAPTRAGKFRDVVAQILLSYTGSCFVIDPKGQAAAVTARYRREVLNQEVAVINPFNIFSSDYLAHVQHAQYNPLKSNLDPDDESYAADADNMAEGLLPYGGPDTHWIDSARLLVSGICQTCRLVSDDASLLDVFRTISGRGIFQYCKDIIAADPTGFVAERLERFAVRTKENRSIVSAAITGLSFIGNTPIARSLSASTVDLAAMTKRPMTVYAILPGRRVGPSNLKWFRLLCNSFADANLREGTKDVPVLAILDEFKDTVGSLNIISTLMGMGAGYGIQVMPILRNITQIQELYPKNWESFLSDCGCTMVFPPRDFTTSEYFSKMAGTTEVRTMSRSISDRQDNPYQLPSGIVDAVNSRIRAATSGGSQISIGTQQRRYLLPEEIRDT